MRYEDDNFIIHYNECDQKYLEKLITILTERAPKILNFFNISSSKVIIKLYDNLDKYKDNITKSFRKTYE